jgi:hypothetical protein
MRERYLIDEDTKEQLRASAMDKLREVFPAVVDYSDFDIEQLVEIMSKPVKSVGSCISKGQLQTLCVQLLAQNITLQAELNKIKGK